MFLSHTNIARFRWPIDDPRLGDFAARIPRVNELAEQSDGFVWRFTGEFKPRGKELSWDDPLRFFNVSVWRDLGSLLTFVRLPQHVAMMQRRSEWIVPVEGPSSALWWIEESTRPDVGDAIRAISWIAVRGETSVAFTARSPFSHQPPAGHSGSEH